MTDFAAQRRELLATIEADLRRLPDTDDRQSIHPNVLAAMARVPREAFVPRHQRGSAYHNTPLPIGHGQTISQPFIVALMTHLMQLGGNEKLLEIGTGSGYQAAVLAELGAEVWTVERIPELGAAAQTRLAELGYADIHIRIGDGNLGWPEHAPYDRIIVTAGAPAVPTALLDQLIPGGRLVIPIGRYNEVQWLTTVDKQEDGTCVSHSGIPVRFVALIRDTDTP